MDKSVHIAAIKEIADMGEEVVFYPKGKSMMPTVMESDGVVLQKTVFPLKKYSVVLYKRRNGEAIMHRVVAKKKDGYVMAGDAQGYIEYPVEEKDIAAAVKEIVRDGKRIKIEVRVSDRIRWLRLIYPLIRLEAKYILSKIKDIRKKER